MQAGGVSSDLLIRSYSEAFTLLLRGLSGITTATALLVFLMLKPQHQESHMTPAEEGV